MSKRVLDSVDSLSFPSEPPHIGNWFSSYAYESPVLSVIDVIQDCDGSKGAWRASESIPYSSVQSEPLGFTDWFSSCVPETPGLNESDDFRVPESVDISFKEHTSSGECDRGSNSKDEENSAENRNNGKNTGTLYDDVNVAYKGLVKCKNSVGDNKRVGQDMDSSYDLSLASEPPDIRNWFSSYIYESPKLDTVQDSIFPDHEKEFDDKEYTSGNNDCWEPQNLRNSLETRFTDDDKYEHQLVSKDQEAVGTKNSTISSEMSLERISQQTAYNKTLQSSNSSSPRLDTEINDIKGSRKNLETMFPQEVNCAISCIINLPSGEESYINPIHRTDSAEKSLKSGHCVESAYNMQPKSSLGMNVASQKLSKREAGGAMDKENQRNDLGGIGFISTRKSRYREMHEKSPLPRPAAVQSPLSGVTVASNCHKHGLTRRKVLTETTNLQNSNVLGTTGKWRCPQKTKPHLGPPLKQLRLEQWVRRA